MATFTVDPATLDELVTRLSHICSDMEGMHTVATGYEGLLGGHDLEGEVEHFSSHWNLGISRLGDHAKKVVQHLQAASATYKTTEGQITQACEGGK
jgi:hypothetical protein